MKNRDIICTMRLCEEVFRVETRNICSNPVIYIAPIHVIRVLLALIPGLQHLSLTFPTKLAS